MSSSNPLPIELTMATTTDGQNVPPKPQSLPDVLINLVDEKDVGQIIQSQKKMLARFEKTNEMLVNCNHLSGVRFEKASKDLKGHITTLIEVKKDLDSIYKRVKILRNKLTLLHPEAFTACQVKVPVAEEDEEES